jgi:hypothetical protein
VFSKVGFLWACPVLVRIWAIFWESCETCTGDFGQFSAHLPTFCPLLKWQSGLLRFLKNQYFVEKWSKIGYFGLKMGIFGVFLGIFVL